jgi:hypothetical protein
MGSEHVVAGRGLLTPIQRAFLSAFASLPDQSAFFLTGGTALSEFYLPTTERDGNDQRQRPRRSPCQANGIV